MYDQSSTDKCIILTSIAGGVCFSRQRYVLGDSAMLSLAQSNVLIYGLGGLGIEIGNQFCFVKFLMINK